MAELAIGRNGKRTITAQKCIAWLLAMASLLIVEPSFAFDGVQIVGTAEKLRIELSNATLHNALAALSTFDLKCRCPASGRRVTGVYEGNIRRVLTRLLEGDDYVVKALPSGGLEVIVLGTNATAQPKSDYPQSAAAGVSDEARGRETPNPIKPNPSYAAAPAEVVGDETRGRGPPNLADKHQH